MGALPYRAHDVARRYNEVIQQVTHSVLTGTPPTTHPHAVPDLHPVVRRLLAALADELQCPVEEQAAWFLRGDRTVPPEILHRVRDFLPQNLHPSIGAVCTNWRFGFLRRPFVPCAVRAMRVSGWPDISADCLRWLDARGCRTVGDVCCVVLQIAVVFQILTEQDTLALLRQQCLRQHGARPDWVERTCNRLGCCCCFAYCCDGGNFIGLTRLRERAAVDYDEVLSYVPSRVPVLLRQLWTEAAIGLPSEVLNQPFPSTTFLYKTPDHSFEAEHSLSDGDDATERSLDSDAADESEPDLVTPALRVQGRTFFDVEEFPFLSTCFGPEDQRTVVREFRTVLDSHPDRFVEADHRGWTVYPLWVWGHPIPTNCATCPRTVQRVLSTVPKVTTIMFSTLQPQGYIPAHVDHEGTSGIRAHYGLVVPSRCAIRVGATARRWTPGEWTVFNGSGPHESVNEGETPRVVLLVDFGGATLHPSVWPDWMTRPYPVDEPEDRGPATPLLSSV